MRTIPDFDCQGALLRPCHPNLRRCGVDKSSSRSGPSRCSNQRCASL